MYLTKEELLEIKGGSVNWTVVSIIGTVITFVAGIIDGYFNPIKCNK